MGLRLAQLMLTPDDFEPYFQYGDRCQCQCQCQSENFSVAKIEELLQSPERRSKVTVESQAAR